MTWTKLSDDHFDREEIFTLSRSAALLNIEATVWCNRLTNDGHVPAAMLGRITTSTDPEADAAELVAGQVWELEPNGWRVDWTDQETNAKITARHETNALKQEAYRDRKEAHAHGDHSKCDPRFCPSLQVVTGNKTGNATSNVTRPLPDPALPVPSRPEGTGDRDRGSAHAATPSARRSHDPQGQEEPLSPWCDGGPCQHILNGLDWMRSNGQVRCVVCRSAQEGSADGGLTWTDDYSGCVFVLKGEGLQMTLPNGDVKYGNRDQWLGAGGKIPPDAQPVNLSDPWTLNGDCEHLEGGLDRSRILNKLRCKQCDKHEQAQAKARAMRAAS